MKKTNFKRIVSLFLLIMITLSFVACTAAGDTSEDGSALSQQTVTSESIQSSKDSSETQSSTISDDSSADDSSLEASVEDKSETTSYPVSEPTSKESSDESTEESSQQSEEQPSEDPSEEVSDSSSEDSSNEISTLNPYYGTDIKPAEGKVIAFTFDDGPSYTSSTKKILDKLEELDMKATFFMVGERVSQGTSAIIQRMVDLGCDIGNHSYDHPNFNSMTVANVKKQIDNTNSLLEKYVGKKASLIRPPYGNITESQMASLNTPIICWDIDSLDWELRNAQKIYDRTIERIHSGGIVLMHDIYDTTADAFCMLADELVSQGYTLVSISELLGTEKLMKTTVKYGFSW